MNRYEPGATVVVSPPNATPFVATVLKDHGTPLVFIGTNDRSTYAPRVILTPAASHLSTGETEQPANAHYRGIMGKRIDRSKQ